MDLKQRDFNVGNREIEPTKREIKAGAARRLIRNVSKQQQVKLPN
jgi:hypothetical protein